MATYTVKLLEGMSNAERRSLQDVIDRVESFVHSGSRRAHLMENRAASAAAAAAASPAAAVSTAAADSPTASPAMILTMGKSGDAGPSDDRRPVTPADVNLHAAINRRREHLASRGSIASRGRLSSRGGADDDLAFFDVLAELDIPAIVHLRRLFTGLGDAVEDESTWEDAVRAETAHSLNHLRFIDVMMSALSMSKHYHLMNRTESERAALVDQLYELFERIDVMGTGEVSWEDFSEFIVHPQADVAFSTLSRSITKYQSQPVTIDMRGDDVERIVYIKSLDKLITCGRNHETCIRNPVDATVERVLTGHSSIVLNTVYCPFQNVLLTSSADRTIIPYDYSSLVRQRIVTVPSPQLCMVHSEELGTLYSGGTDGIVRMWDVHKNEVVPKSSHILGSHDDMVMDIICPAGRGMAITAGLDAKVKVWDIYTNHLGLAQCGHSNGVYSLVHCDAQRLVMSGGCDREILVWNPVVRGAITRMHGHEKSIIQLHMVDGSPELISGDAGGTIKIWDVRKFECMQTFRARGLVDFDYQGPIRTFCHNATAKQIVTVGMKWVMWTAEADTDADLTSRYTISSVVYNPVFAQFVVVAGSEVTAWAAQTGALVAKYDHFTDGDVGCLTFDDRDRQILVGNPDGTVSIFDYHTGDRICRFVAVPDEEVSHIFRSGPRDILCASRYGHLHVFSLREPTAPEEIRNWTVSTSSEDTPCIAHAPEARLVATGGADKAVQLWRIDSGTLFRSLEVQSDITACRFAENLKAFVTADRRSTLSIYSMPQLELVVTIKLGNLPRATSYMAYQQSDHILVTDLYERDVVAWDMDVVLHDFARHVRARPSAENRPRPGSAGARLEAKMRSNREEKVEVTEDEEKEEEEEEASEMVQTTSMGADSSDSESDTDDKPPPFRTKMVRPDPAVTIEILEERPAASRSGPLVKNFGVPLPDGYRPLAYTHAGAGTAALCTWTPHPDSLVHALAVVSDPPAIVTGSLNGRVRLWSTSGDPYGTLVQDADRHTWRLPVDREHIRGTRRQATETTLRRIANAEEQQAGGEVSPRIRESVLRAQSRLGGQPSIRWADQTAARTRSRRHRRERDTVGAEGVSTEAVADRAASRARRERRHLRRKERRPAADEDVRTWLAREGGTGLVSSSDEDSSDASDDNPFRRVRARRRNEWTALAGISDSDSSDSGGRRPPRWPGARAAEVEIGQVEAVEDEPGQEPAADDSRSASRLSMRSSSRASGATDSHLSVRHGTPLRALSPYLLKRLGILEEEEKSPESAKPEPRSAIARLRSRALAVAAGASVAVARRRAVEAAEKEADAEVQQRRQARQKVRLARSVTAAIF